MPATIKMNINHLNYGMNQYKNAILQRSTPAPVKVANAPSTLHSPMIGRIFRTKPGCGSCGK
jgi:hypothetical protein